MSIGENIKFIRKRRKLTQKELAKRTGLAESTIQKYEADKFKPRKEQLEILAGALNVSSSEIIGLELLDLPKFEDLTTDQQLAYLEAEKEGAIESKIDSLLYYRYGEDYAVFEDFRNLNAEGKLIVSEFIAYLKKTRRYSIFSDQQ